MEGLKSFSRVLTNASVSQVRQGSGQLNIKATTHGQGYLPLLLGIPLQVASGLAHGHKVG